MWKPMLPLLVEDIPISDKWLYQVKYDGFRCGLKWTDHSVTIWSRNGTDLTSSFPEIVSWCDNNKEKYKKNLPMFLDGELVQFITPFHTDFEHIQLRARLKTNTKINYYCQHRPTSFVCFDILYWAGIDLEKKEWLERDKLITKLFGEETDIVQKAPTFNNVETIKAIVELHQAEGIIAKLANSTYQKGKRTKSWQKIKNYRTIQGVITKWNMKNDYFTVTHYIDDALEVLGKCKNGFTSNQKQTLIDFIKQNGQKINATTWKVKPATCIDIHCLSATDQEIREPYFHQFRFDLVPTDCTDKTVKLGLAQFPQEVSLSKLNKYLFPHVKKLDYLCYLRFTAPLLLSKLKDRLLTLIRYPDGVAHHSFYQKHVPDYAPDFIEFRVTEGGDKHMLCQDLRSLIWFGNHGGIEFHVPFNKSDNTNPDEMVFDLDPPSIKHFQLAVKAALLIKEMMEYQGFIPFVKTSGKTGLQVHIPIQEMTYQETRTLLEAVAKVLIKEYPDLFTIERLIKNRGNRLYIDFVQHGPGKTIIAPYSTRATKEATVATPLFWDEVNDQLNPLDFTIHTVPDRLKEKGCPFNKYYQILLSP
ncbi:DNA ligase D [Gracilibacillus massiliensis]|uniref:DNA ligase D n=1 Tax=Gracilibacillus massiliensis TaxID=1564956 RepID=UPI00071D0781|nr:DNA ligase D [Gracilibacillus massiliensis]